VSEVSPAPIHVDRRGTEGPALVLLHGFGATNITWRKWVPQLEKHFQLHLIELKGHGKAPAPPDGHYSPRDNAEEVVRYLRTIQADHIVLVGHSMGGGIAMLVALALMEETPRKLRALVSLAGAAYPQPLPPFIGLARRRILTRVVFRILPKRLLIRTLLKWIVVDPSVVDRAQIESYAAPLMDRSHWNAIVQTALQILPPDLEEITRRFSQISVPVLALWGERDRVVPLAVGQRLADELPNARLVLLRECGHIPTEEKPAESLEALLTFLTECDLTEAPA
jgi:pimeloyl-ACP methyl ester carboxylesterase